MGRTDAVTFVLECVRAWRALGAEVTFEQGFETRGNGTAADYVGGLVHHTASPSSQARPFPTRSMLIGGRPDLRGPLCNVAGPWCPPDSPLLHVIAAHPANHAGASGGVSMGPLPFTRLFNRHVLGLEVDYAGTTPMAPGQYAAMTIFAAGVSRVLGRPSAEWVRGHAETSITGKWDPGYAPNRTIDLAAFRRQVQQLMHAQEDDMFSAEDRAVLQSLARRVDVGHARSQVLSRLGVADPESYPDARTAAEIAVDEPARRVDVEAVAARLDRLDARLDELAAGGIAPAAVEAAIRAALAAIAASPSTTTGA